MMDNNILIQTLLKKHPRVTVTFEELEDAIALVHTRYSREYYERWEDVVTRRQEDQTFEEIATRLKISRARASQLYWGHIKRIYGIIRRSKLVKLAIEAKLD
jgi:hypothetical protein